MDTLTIEQLADRSGVSRRTIRFYVYEGLLEPPAGNTKGASYSPQHLERLERIKQMSARGYSLRQIRQLLTAGGEQEAPPPPAGSVAVRTHITLADGVELSVDAHKAQLSSGEVRQLAEEILKTITTIRQSPPHNKGETS